MSMSMSMSTYILSIFNIQPKTQNKLAICHCLIYHILSMNYVQATVKSQNKSPYLYVGHCLLVSNSKKCTYQKCTTIHIKKCTYQHQYHPSKEHKAIFNHQLQQVLVWTCQVPMLMQHHSQVLKTKNEKNIKVTYTIKQ